MCREPTPSPWIGVSATRKHQKLGYFDTGIFATDVLIRTLLENGGAELAVDILTNNGTQGFEHWRQNGATTFCGYAELVISPMAVSKFGRMSGSMDTPNSTGSVRYKKEEGGIRFHISIPAGCRASFRFASHTRELSVGENEFVLTEF